MIWGHHPVTRNVPNLLRNLALAVKTIRKERPDVVFSDGAGIGLPFIWVGRAFGCRTVYMELLDRIETATMNARAAPPRDRAVPRAVAPAGEALPRFVARRPGVLRGDDERPAADARDGGYRPPPHQPIDGLGRRVRHEPRRTSPVHRPARLLCAPRAKNVEATQMLGFEEFQELLRTADVLLTPGPTTIMEALEYGLRGICVPASSRHGRARRQQPGQCRPLASHLKGRSAPQAWSTSCSRFSTRRSRTPRRTGSTLPISPSRRVSRDRRGRRCTRVGAGDPRS